METGAAKMDIVGRLYDVFLDDRYVGSMYGEDGQEAISAARRAYKKRKGRRGRWRATDAREGIVTFPDEQKESLT